MPCKHEGGTDPCVRYPSGVCSAQRREYDRVNTYKTGRAGSENSRVGYIGELLVVADLNHRCGRAYLNPMPQTPDDAYVRTSEGWRTVQVKVGRLNIRTGALFHHTKRSNISSDIIAVVSPVFDRVRYIPGARSLPPEIPAGPHPICSNVALKLKNGKTTCQSIPTPARSAGRSRKGSSRSKTATAKTASAVASLSASKSRPPLRSESGSTAKAVD